MDQEKIGSEFPVFIGHSCEISHLPSDSNEEHSKARLTTISSDFEINFLFLPRGTSEYIKLKAKLDKYSQD